jgi:hypothetical protein
MKMKKGRINEILVELKRHKVSLLTYRDSNVGVALTFISRNEKLLTDLPHFNVPYKSILTVSLPVMAIDISYTELGLTELGATIVYLWMGSEIDSMFQKFTKR